MALTKEELEFISQQEASIRELQAKAALGQTQNYQEQMYVQHQEKGMVKEQLDLGEEMERIENLLRGKYLKNGSWQDPTDDSMVILTEYGLQLIINTVAWYINKNTLLSNYDEDTINFKMKTFCKTLARTIFMEYEKIFKYPSFEDCVKILESRMEYKLKLRKFATEKLGNQFDEKQTREDIVKEMEGKIEREIEVIKQQNIKAKLKRFLIIVREVQDAVHSTYLRAWNGQERKTLREHIQISEMKGGNQPPVQKSSLNPLNWLKRN